MKDIVKLARVILLAFLLITTSYVYGQTHLHFKVTQPERLVAEAGQLKRVQAGRLVQLGGSPTATGGYPPYTYSWTYTQATDSFSVPNPLVIVEIEVSYTLVVTDRQGCTSRDSVLIDTVEVTDTVFIPDTVTTIPDWVHSPALSGANILFIAAYDKHLHKISLRCADGVRLPARVNIVDILGHTVYSSVLYGKNKLFDVPRLPKGVYFVRIDSVNHVCKFMVQ